MANSRGTRLTQFYYLQCSFDPLENLFSGTRPRFNLSQPPPTSEEPNAAHIRRRLWRGSGRGARIPAAGSFERAEKVVFRDVVASADPGHFRHEDRELLALYCAQVIAARGLMKKRRRAAEQERDLRATTALIITLSHQTEVGRSRRAPDNRRAASAGMRIPGPKPSYPQPRAETPEAAREEPKAPGDQRWNST